MENSCTHTEKERRWGERGFQKIREKVSHAFCNTAFLLRRIPTIHTNITHSSQKEAIVFLHTYPFVGYRSCLSTRDYYWIFLPHWYVSGWCFVWVKTVLRLQHDDFVFVTLVRVCWVTRSLCCCWSGVSGFTMGIGIGCGRGRIPPNKATADPPPPK